MELEDQQRLFPDGLSRTQHESLLASSEEAEEMSLQVLEAAAQKHIELTKQAHGQSPMVNLRLAEAICAAFAKVFNEWDSLTGGQRYWLGGACMYFVESDDDDSDFESPTGFEDDAEILNACLRFAGLEAFCLNVEDNDDV